MLDKFLLIFKIYTALIGTIKHYRALYPIIAIILSIISIIISTYGELTSLKKRDMEFSISKNILNGAKSRDYIKDVTNRCLKDEIILNGTLQKVNNKWEISIWKNEFLCPDEIYNFKRILINELNSEECASFFDNLTNTQSIYKGKTHYNHITYFLNNPSSNILCTKIKHLFFHTLQYSNNAKSNFNYLSMFLKKTGDKRLRKYTWNALIIISKDELKNNTCSDSSHLYENVDIILNNYDWNSFI